MATARKLPSGNWRAQVYDYTDGEGKRHYKSFTAGSKKEALFQAAQYSLYKKDKSNMSRITFGEALEAYISSREAVLSPGTIREYRRAVKDYEDLRNIRLNELTQDHIQKHINSFSENHSPKSVRNNHGIISAVLRMHRPDMPLNTVLPQKQRPDLYIPNDNDIKAIINTAKGTDMELPILLAAFGPMRRGEICALTTDNISGNRVHVCKNLVENKNREWVVKQPKSYAGDRFIDYPDFVADMLSAKQGRVTDLNPNMITGRFKHILSNAGVPHFRFHDLRHYGASILHALGMPDAYIMERGGWGNDAVLKNVYRHTLEDKKSEMTNKANSYFQNMQHDMQHGN